jgi:hypothetical protein
MSSLICSLTICLTLQGVKAELIAQYPGYEKQIKQVGVPSIGYRSHMPFYWRRLAFIKGKCDAFKNPQIMAVRNKRHHITLYRLRHELQHFVLFAAGLPEREHQRLDSQ